MEKRPIYVSVFVCLVLWFCHYFSIGGDVVGEDILSWGHFFVGFLLLSNYLVKK